MELSRRERAKRRLAIIAILAVLLGAGYWYFRKDIPSSLQSVVSFENAAEQSAIKLLTVTTSTKKSVVAPPPLKASAPVPGKTSSDALTRAGIIANTNAQRATNGLGPLAEDATLDAIASLRLDDMFAKQYFAHVAPDGSSVTTVAKTVNYEYLTIGENLALGNFAGDKGVVDAWMGSPGHRANILNIHYTKIGVAAKKGTYQGEITWIAVQIFARPASDCPAPDPNLKATVDAAESQLSQMETDLQSKKAALDAMEPKAGDAYNQKVNEYNAEVAQYNTLLQTAKGEIAQFNGQVQAYNACIAQ